MRLGSQLRRVISSSSQIQIGYYKGSRERNEYRQGGDQGIREHDGGDREKGQIVLLGPTSVPEVAPRHGSLYASIDQKISREMRGRMTSRKLLSYKAPRDRS